MSKGVLVPSTLVIGAGGKRYRAPDVATVDKHLHELVAELGKRQTVIAPARKQIIRLDIDRLLEARLALKRTAT